MGEQLVGAGFLTKAQRDDAVKRYREWIRAGLVEQTLEIRAVAGTRQ